jgi:hypothetical protein
VTLRRDVHSAFDQITPSMGGLSERVVQTVLAEGATRRRKEGMLFRMRAPLSLVAVLLVIALVAAVLVFGRLTQRPTTVHNPPTASPQAEIDQAELARLEAIPLNLPVMQTNDTCVETQFDGVTGRQSTGHAAFQGASVPRRDTWGLTYHVYVYVNRQVAGLVLIRGRDLKTQQPALWGGDYAHGPVGDTEQPQLHTELLINMGSHPRDGEQRVLANSAFKAGHSDCFGLQIDGRGFSEQMIGKH